MTKDSKAFGVLMSEYKETVFRVCMGFVHHSQDAEDIAQDVFVQVFFSIENFRKDASLATWLYRVAVNKSINFLNRVKKKAKENLVNDADIAAVWASDKTTPEGDMELRERNAALYAAIDSLPENQRVAFTMSKCDELSYKEIADVMGLSVSSVESLIHRAKLGMQKKMIKWYKNEI
jgi:RNA polymerase sigma-70 factor (ECF subfamily)